MKNYYRNSFFLVVALLICSGCGGRDDRDTSTLSKAIIGQWQVIRFTELFPDELPKPKYIFFRPDGTTRSEYEGGLFTGSPYTVRESSQDLLTLVLLVDTEPLEVTFSNDYKTMIWELSDVDMAEKGFVYECKYVGSKLSP